MAKHALSLFLKITLFAVVMLIVAKTVHYDDLVSSFLSQHMSANNADNIGKWVLGEPDPEPFDSVRFYISIVINTLISIPAMSAIITVYNGVTRKVRPMRLLKEWAFSILRRLTKLFTFTFLFWGMFRLLPYQAVFPDEKTYSAFSTVAVVAFNLLLTIACYGFITKKITTKRRL